MSHTPRFNSCFTHEAARKGLLALSMFAFVLCPTATAVAPRAKSCATLSLVNRTDRPIYVYLDGKFITCCESGMRAVVECSMLGDITGIGRFRCDTWGPRQLTLKAGEQTEWILAEQSEGP